MPRIVYLDNWQTSLESTIADVLHTASTFSHGAIERDILISELGVLKELRRQVHEIAPDERKEVNSVLMAVSVREHLDIPDDLVQRVGELFDIYRRLRQRL